VIAIDFENALVTIRWADIGLERAGERPREVVVVVHLVADQDGVVRLGDGDEFPHRLRGVDSTSRVVRRIDNDRGRLLARGRADIIRIQLPLLVRRDEALRSAQHRRLSRVVGVDGVSQQDLAPALALEGPRHREVVRLARAVGDDDLIGIDAAACCDLLAQLQ